MTEREPPSSGGVGGREAPSALGDDAVLGQLLPAFEGTTPPAWLLQRVADGHAHGVTVFLRANAVSATAIAGLIEQLQAVVPEHLPLIIGADQEGGQLVGLGHDTTRFPGAMALGAADDEILTEAVGRATGLELRALGVTVDYAPVCDVAVEPANVSLGTRAFGSEPELVARHAAAMARGLQDAGVAATAKHFPGFGAVSRDPHDELAAVAGDLAFLEARELLPFRAAIAAGTRMVMSGHVALPDLTGDRSLPATVSRALMHDLLRVRLGFHGVSITDAMDMGAVGQGGGNVVDGIMALRAGIDLLLLTPDRAAQRLLEDGVRQAARRGLIPAGDISAAHGRILELRRWLGRFGRPEPTIVRGRSHRELARRAARAALTLVRDDAGTLPLRPQPGRQVAVITPRPRDLTPADSSAQEPLALADAVRRHHADVIDIRVAADPSEAQVAQARAAASEAAVAIVVTLATGVQPGQARLVQAILATGTPTVTVAMRTPYDLADYPRSATHLCAYSIVPASVGAVADALFGRIALGGHLPVDIPGLYRRGHGMEVAGWA